MSDGKLALVLARMDSRRLPGKVLADLGGKPMLARAVERVTLARGVGRIVVATSTRAVDDPIVAWARKAGVDAFRGSADDVARRALACCRERGAEAFLRISADSPFVDPQVIDDVCALYDRQELDIATNVHPRTFPPGCSAEVVRTAALERAMGEAGDDAEAQEHVTLAFYRAPDRYRIANLRSDRGYGVLRLTVDNADELARARRIMARAGRSPERLTLAEVAALADETVPAL